MLMKVTEVLEPLQRLRTAVPEKLGPALESLIGTLPMPIDQPEVANALGMAAYCFAEYAKEIPYVRLYFRELIADIEETHKYIHENQVTIQGLPPAGQMEGRCGDFPAYALLVSLQEEQRTLQIAVGAEIAAALLDQRQLNPEYCTRLRRDARKYGRPEAGTEREIEDLADQKFGRSWLGRFRKVDRQVRRRVEIQDPNGPDQPKHANPAHQLDLLARLMWRFEYPDPRHRQGALDHSHLSPTQFRLAAVEIKRGVEDGNAAAVVEAICVLVRLTPDLTLSIPLNDKHQRYKILWLDVERGVLSLNLNELFPNRMRPAPITAHLFQKSSDVLEVPLADFMVIELQKRYAEFPRAQLLGDLVGWIAVDTRKSLLADANCKLIPSLARASKSTGAFALRCGVNRMVTSCLTMDFSYIGSARAYYARLTGADIHGGCSKLHEAMGWGVPAIAEQSLQAIGSHCVLSEAGVGLVFGHLKELTVQSQPPRRATLKTLLEHHAHYTRYSAALLSFCLGLREVKVYRLMASELSGGQVQVLIHDKRGGDVLMAQPVYLNSIAREQVKQYLGHCEASLKRVIGFKEKEAINLAAMLTRILNGQGTLFVFSSRNSTRPAGSKNTWGAMPEQFRIPGNVGRHFWQNAFRESGLGSRDIDRFMRHRIVGVENNTTSQIASPKASFDRIEQVQLKVLSRLGIQALSGLRRV